MAHPIINNLFYKHYELDKYNTIMKGDTKVEHLGTPSRNTKKRAWFMTWNHYDVQDIDYIKNLCSKNCEYTFGEEVSKSGTPHLQIVIRWKNGREFSAVKKKFPKCHIEICRSWIASKQYCCKDGITHSNIVEKVKQRPLKERLLEKMYPKVVFKPWQKKLLDKLNNEPDDRKIFWIYEEKGGIGKSFLCRYIGLKYDALICTGKTADIFNQVNIWRMKNPDVMQIPMCIIDIPRSLFHHVNYAALEQLKNGFMYSGKYEGGTIYGLPPHVIIFANSKPDLDKFSRDRWHVIHVTEHDKGNVRVDSLKDAHLTVPCEMSLALLKE